MSARFAAWAVATLVALAAPAAALAQGSPTASPTAKPDAKKKDEPKKDEPKKADPKADPKKGEPKKGDAKPGAAGALPEGHPPVDDSLPEGHPPVGDDGDEPARKPAGKPKNPHGGGGGGDPGFFQPPEDGSADDPELPVGTIVVSVRDAMDKPVPRAPLELGILHNTVAKGESTERLSRETDEQGIARFDALQIGAGVSYRAKVASGAASFEVQPFNLSDKSGKRAVLHVYEVTSDTKDLRAGMWGVVFIQLREDALSIEQHMTVLNVDPVAWVPEGTVIGLPDGYKAYVKPDGMGAAVRWDELKDEGASLKGTVTPGQHETGFRYQVPLEGTEKQTFKIRMPAKTFQMGIMAEASKTMALQVTGFPAAQRTDRGGRKVLVTKKQVGAAGENIDEIEITVSGLPVPGPGRWIAVALGVAAIGGGAFYAKRRKDDGEMADDVRLDLEEAKKTLLDEIVALERAHKKGEVGPKTYARVRVGLLDALARIVHKLDAARPRPRAARMERATAR